MKQFATFALLTIAYAAFAAIYAFDLAENADIEEEAVPQWH